MSPQKSTVSVALSSCEGRHFAQSCEDLALTHSVLENSSLEHELKEILKKLVSKSSDVVQLSSQILSSTQSSQRNLDGNLTCLSDQRVWNPSTWATSHLIPSISPWTVCHFQRNGMAVNYRDCAEEDQDDSGFGSGSRALRSLPSTETDFEILKRNSRQLSDSGCYFGPLDNNDARRLLRKSEIGSFLLRDSSDPNYLYSLTVKTERGATSVRILYCKGLFQFDSDEKLRHRLPRFESIMSLIDFHIMLSRDGKNQKWRWEENSGKKMMKVVLYKPRKCTVPSLQHLSRVRINQSMENVHLPALSVDRLPMLPGKLKDYLKDYPFRV